MFDRKAYMHEYNKANRKRKLAWYYSNKKPTIEYRTWRNMRYRCNCPNSKEYNRYGGRGIKVCKRWNDYKKFLKDMGNRPGDSYSIDRIDNNKGYSPNNCRWATRKEQANNHPQGNQWKKFYNI